jgi:hypothetical protein
VSSGVHAATVEASGAPAAATATGERVVGMEGGDQQHRSSRSDEKSTQH